MLEMQDRTSKFSLKSIASGKQVHRRVFEAFVKYLYTNDVKDDQMTVQNGLYLCECDEFFQIVDNNGLKQ